MTDAEKLAVLRLWGLERIEDATRDSWPWWWEDPRRWPDYTPASIAFMPDFASDRQAAKKLAAKMDEEAKVIHQTVSEDPARLRSMGGSARPTMHNVIWKGAMSGGFTSFGAALLAALTA